MNFLSNLKIGTRLTLAFATILLLAVIVGVIGLSRLSELSGDLALIRGELEPKAEKVVVVVDDVNLVARELRNTIIFRDDQKVAAAIETVLAARARIAQVLTELAPTITSEEGKKHLAATTDALGQYAPAQQRFIDKVRAGEKDTAVVLLQTELRPAQLEFMKALNGLKALQIRLITKAAQDGEASYQQADRKSVV